MLLIAKGFAACLERWVQSEVLVVFVWGVVELELDLGRLLLGLHEGDREQLSHLFIFKGTIILPGSFLGHSFCHTLRARCFKKDPDL